MSSKRQKIILYVVNVDWFFISHRLALAQKAIESGFEVHIATKYTSHRESIERYGIITHELNYSRDRIGDINFLGSVKDILKIFFKVKPNLVHTVTLKLSCLVAISSLFIKRSAFIYAISGLGRIFTIQDPRNGLVKSMIYCLFLVLSILKNFKLIFQNQDDLNDFCHFSKRLKSRSVIFRGSGVDLERFQPGNIYLNHQKRIILFASRLLETKGIRDFISAIKLFDQRELVYKYPDVRFLIAGATDKENPDSLDDDEIQLWDNISVLDYIGFSENIHETLNLAYCLVLPSYREGMPLIICQASACGIPVITTNVPGCRSSIINGKTGLLVELQNPESILSAITNLLDDVTLHQSMKLNARKFAESEFNLKSIIREHIKIYNKLLN